MWEQLKGDQPSVYANKLHVDLDNWKKHEAALSTELTLHPQNNDQWTQAVEAEIAIGRMRLELGKIHRVNNPTELLLSRVESQCALEPSTGTCDAVLVTVIPLPTPTPKTFAAYNASRFVTANYKPALLKAAFLPPEALLDDQAPLDGSEGEPKKRKSETPLYDFPLQVQSGDYLPFELKLKSTMPQIPYIILPQLIVEYKKPADDEIKALNQTRMYDISNVLYFDSLGIKSYPVFSLAVHGTRAALIMGWKSRNGVSTDFLLYGDTWSHLAF